MFLNKQWKLIEGHTHWGCVLQKPCTIKMDLRTMVSTAAVWSPVMKPWDERFCCRLHVVLTYRPWIISSWWKCWWGHVFCEQLTQAQDPQQPLSGIPQIEDDRSKSAPTSPCDQGRHIFWLLNSEEQTEWRHTAQLLFFLVSCRREGAGEHPEGSVIWPPRRGAQNTPTVFLLVCGHGNVWHAHRRWWEQRRRGKRRKSGEWRGQRSQRSRGQEDEPAWLCVYQSSGERKLWKGGLTSSAALFVKFSKMWKHKRVCVMWPGDAGGDEGHRRGLCRQGAEERRYPAGWRRGLHHDWETDLSIGQETPLSDTALLLLPD